MERNGNEENHIKDPRKRAPLYLCRAWWYGNFHSVSSEHVPYALGKLLAHTSSEFTGAHSPDSGQKSVLLAPFRLVYIRIPFYAADCAIQFRGIQYKIHIYFTVYLVYILYTIGWQMPIQWHPLEVNVRSSSQHSDGQHITPSRALIPV